MTRKVSVHVEVEIGPKTHRCYGESEKVGHWRSVEVSVRRSITKILQLLQEDERSGMFKVSPPQGSR